MTACITFVAGACDNERVNPKLPKPTQQYYWTLANYFAHERQCSVDRIQIEVLYKGSVSVDYCFPHREGGGGRRRRRRRRRERERERERGGGGGQRGWERLCIITPTERNSNSKTKQIQKNNNDKTLGYVFVVSLNHFARCRN